MGGWGVWKTNCVHGDFRERSLFLGLVGLTRVGVNHETRFVDGFKVGTFYLTELGDEGVVVPTFVGRAADVPVAAVVSEEHTIFFEGAEDDPGLGGEAADVEIRLETKALSHRGYVGVGDVGCLVAGGPDEGTACAFGGEAEGVLDFTLRDLVVAGEEGEDG